MQAKTKNKKAKLKQNTKNNNNKRSNTLPTPTHFFYSEGSFCENVIEKLLAQKKLPKRLQNICSKQNVFEISIKKERINKTA